MRGDSASGSTFHRHLGIDSARAGRTTICTEGGLSRCKEVAKSGFVLVLVRATRICEGQGGLFL